MKKLLQKIAFVYILLTSLTLSAQSNQDDYTALRALYLNANGDGWYDRTGWLDAATFMANPTIPTGTDMSTWYGIVLDDNGRVGEIDLGENLLAGNIPPEIDRLTAITGLYLYDNQLTGNIPVEIGNMTTLAYLDLSFNQLMGDIPTEIGNLINLEELDLYTNQLTSIPVEIGNLTNLTKLDLNDNQLSGNIPATIGNLTNLSQLYLYFNFLTGPIPSTIGNLTNLTELLLNDNQLTGNIPSSVGNLANLNALVVNDNQLSGCYDPALANLCGQIFTNTNANISTGNTFDANWEDFCNTQAGTGIAINLKAYLQGAYQVASGEMTTTLNSDRSLLPGQTPSSPLATPTPAGQPYGIAPWNYTGTEGADWTGDAYATDAVDWVLVSLRTGTAKASQVAMTAGVLNKDGSIYFPNRCVLSVNENSVYIVVEHRNHIGIMTPAPVSITNSTLTYDFTQANTYDGNGTGAGQLEIAPGIWAMYTGDGDQISDVGSYDINGPDKTVWFETNGVFDNYLPADYNLDGDVNGQDKSLWFDNNGVSSRVPK